MAIGKFPSDAFDNDKVQVCVCVVVAHACDGVRAVISRERCPGNSSQWQGSGCLSVLALEVHEAGPYRLRTRASVGLAPKYRLWLPLQHLRKQPQRARRIFDLF